MLGMLQKLIRALAEGEDMGRYLTVSGEMMMNDVAKSLKVAHLKKVDCLGSPLLVSNHCIVFPPENRCIELGASSKKLYGMRVSRGCEWNGEPLDSIQDTTPPILENELF